MTVPTRRSVDSVDMYTAAIQKAGRQSIRRSTVRRSEIEDGEETGMEVVAKQSSNRKSRGRGSSGFSESVYELVTQGNESDSSVEEDPEVNRVWMKNLLTSTTSQAFVSVLIVFNAVVIGMETDNPGSVSLSRVEDVLLFLFSIELFGRIYAYRCTAFFNIHGPDITWNLFDTCIVSFGITDSLMQAIGGKGGSLSNIGRLCRLTRILRIFRLVRFMSHLYVLAYGFLLAAVAVFWVTVLMAVAMYICSILLVRTVGHYPKDFECSEIFHTNFGDIQEAIFSLFQIAMQPRVNTYRSCVRGSPAFLLFLILFIIFGSFGMIALLTGVISEAMFEKNVVRNMADRREREDLVNMFAMSAVEIFDTVGKDQISPEEVLALTPELEELLITHSIAYDKDDLVRILRLMDTDMSGGIDKVRFCRGLLQLIEDVRPLLLMELHSDNMVYFKSRMEEWEACTKLLLKRYSQLQKKTTAVAKTLQQGRGPAGQKSAIGVVAEPGTQGSVGKSCHASAPGSDLAKAKGCREDVRTLMRRTRHNFRSTRGALLAAGDRLEVMAGRERQMHQSSGQDKAGQDVHLDEWVGTMSRVAKRVSESEYAIRQACSDTSTISDQLCAAKLLGQEILVPQGRRSSKQGISARGARTMSKGSNTQGYAEGQVASRAPEFSV